MTTPTSDADELALLDATGQAELVRGGELSAVDLVSRAIERIERLNPQLGAVIHEHFERALEEAGGELPDGPFRGVPFLLKDLAGGHRQGDPNHWGTRFLRDAGYRAPRTAYLVEKFERAGLVVVGRSNVPELGAWTTTEPESTGPARNPWNPEHSCGGSSGGAAAAVASGMVPLAHASDGGGSIRNPASQAGLLGLKPTRGRISLGPDVGEDWAGMAFEFALTKSVRDTATLLDAVQGAMPGDPYQAPPPVRPYREEVGADPGSLRVGIWTDVPDVKVAEVCRDAASAAASQLEQLGHRVEPDRPAALGDPELAPHVLNVIASSQARLVEELGGWIGREIGPADMDIDNWTVTEIGRGVSASSYLAAVHYYHGYQRRVAAWWAGGFDLLVTPCLPEPPPPLGVLVPKPEEPLAGFMRSGQLTHFLLPFNITGQPALSVPFAWTDDGLPVGVQLIADFGREDLLLRVAAQLEEAHPWRGRLPPVFA